jgi:hypothetical protein
MSVLAQLISMRTQLDTMIAAASNGADVKTMTKTKKVSADKTEKKPRANAGQGTAWSSFCKKIMEEHKEAFEKVKADDKAARAVAKEAGDDAPKAGAHLVWCSGYKTAHEAEWLAYKAEWDAAHPKSSKSSVADGASVAGSEADGEAAAPKAKAKKVKAPLSDDEKAAKKAKAAATKAAKAAKAAPAAAPVAEADDEADDAVLEDDEEAPAATEEAPAPVEVPAAAEEAAEEEAPTPATLVPFNLKKVKYLRLCQEDEDGNAVKADGDNLWLITADGSRGEWVGQIRGDVISKKDAEEPNLDE